MSENTIYFWSDRSERAYATLRHGDNRWRLEWGYRDPPASDNFVQRGEHVTSLRDEAVRWMVAQVRRLSSDPDDAARVAEQLRVAIAEEVR
jgi:hypothetical protein